MQPDWAVYHADFRQLPIAGGSADLILTDPPYGADYLPLWDDLGAFAARTLKPDGLLIAYSGKHYLPDVYASLARHLTYQHTCCLYYARPCRQWRPMGGRRWLYHTRWRPILLFSQKGWSPPFRLLCDTLDSGEPEKDLHPWQQPLTEALYLIDRLAKPGALVCDPMMGSGTAGKAVVLLGRGRRFVGCDVCPVSVEVARKRLAA